MLASRTKSKCDAIAADIKHMNIQTAALDADNVPEIVALINQFKPDLVMNIALPYQDLTIMDACLETGVHYLDTANYEPKDEAKFEYKGTGVSRKFKEKGIMALLGLWFRSRQSQIYVAHAAKHHLMKCII